MPKIEVWKCPRTGKLYENLRNYKKHLREMATRSLNERREIRRVDSARTKLRTQVRSIADLEALLPKVLLEYVSLKTGVVFPKLPTDSIQVRFQLLNHRDMCCNSHCAPVDGRTNWHGNPKLPIGYPGFYGRVVILLSGKLYNLRVDGHSMPTDVLKQLMVNTGSGGGGAGSLNMIQLGYEVTLFDDDWPGLARAYHEEQMIKKLSA